MTDSPAAPIAGDRLAKVIARSGLCSRRDAEEWIKAGRVTVNGRKLMTPAFNVIETDVILVDGEPLAEREGTRVWLYHKPRGLVVTEKDPEGRPTVFESVAEKGLPRVVSVGRLDINTEGLLLLTNDGGLKRVLELPATGWLRKYRVRAHGTVTQAQLDSLKKGVEVDGINYGPIEATLERDQGANVWLEVALREGKNREIKNVLMALGLEVNRLIRISFGPFQLGDLPVGGIEAVKARVLKDQLGRRLAEQAEADFESAMPEGAKPVRGRVTSVEREHGRGTHTTTIDKHRFRFTDRAEMSPAEAAERRTARAAERTAPGNKGKPAWKGGRDVEPPTRRIHFDDGREPTVYEEKTYGKKARPAAGAPFVGGRDRDVKSGPRKPGGAGRAFAPRDRADGDAPSTPFRGRGDGAGERPAREFKPRSEGASDRPARAFRPRQDEGAERPSRPPFRQRPDGSGDRPARSFGGRPAGNASGKPQRSFKPRSRAADGGAPAGDRPFRKKFTPGGEGVSRARPSGAADRPFRRGPTADGDRPAGRPTGNRPAGAPRGPRPGGARPPRKDGPPRGPSRPREK